MHHRFGLFGTERTGAGIIKYGQFDRFPPVAGFGGSRSGTSEGGGGGGPRRGDRPDGFRVLRPLAFERTFGWSPPSSTISGSGARYTKRYLRRIANGIGGRTPAPCHDKALASLMFWLQRDSER